MKLSEEKIRKIHYYPDNEHIVIVEKAEEYHYDNIEERMEHIARMRNEGWIETRQEEENIGSFCNPVYVIFAAFYKYEEIIQ